MSIVSSDLGVPQFMTDGQGRLCIGDDLEVTSGQSAANASQTVTVASGLKRRLLQITVKYSGAVTQNVTVTLVSALGAAWNTILDTIALSAATDGVSTKVIGMELAPGDSLQVAAPAAGVGGVTSAIAIYDQIIGLTQRASDATS